jgi:PAS domain S-box-containing protein
VLIVLLYLLIGSLWILFSDRMVMVTFQDPQVITYVQTFKGWFYVFGSGVLIFFLLKQALGNLQRKEKALRSQKMMQENFLAQHFQPLWKSDKMGNCVFFNDKWLEFTGFAVPSEKPFAWLDAIHPDDKPLCIEKFSQGFISRSFFELEYRLKVNNSQYVWVLNTCMPYYEADGEFDGFFGFYQDLQDKKLLQEKYKESSKRYGYLFANNPNPMLVYDTSDLRILEANKAALLLYGYNEREFFSLSIIDLRPASEIPAFMEHISDSLPDFHRSSGWVHQKKDGTTFDAEVTAHSLPINNNKNLRMVIVRDITDQIRAFRIAKEGDRRFKTIFNYSPQGAVICSEDLLILDANPAALKILDFSVNDLERISLPEFLNTDIDPAAFDYINKLRDGMPLYAEVNMLRRKGVEFRASFNAVRFTESGQIRYYFSFNDIDEKYRMQMALQESERINTTLVSNLPGMVYRCRNDRSWTMTFVSFGVENLTGYKPPELMHNNVVSYEEIIHPDDRQIVRTAVKVSLSNRNKFDIQYRILDRNKREKWVWEQGHGITNSFGELLYIEGFIIDITREKEARQQVEFQSYFLSLILDNIPFPLFYKDVEGKFTGCNRAFCEFLNLPREEIVGKSVFDLFAKEQAKVFDDKDKELLQTGGMQSYETQITFADGRRMDAVFHKSVFHDRKNSPLGIVGVYFDITERVQAEKVIKKQLEELGRINSELERFSYTVSHDLRSPLVTIKGFLGLLKEDIEEQNQEQVAEDIMRIGNATDKMQQLLEDLLKLSRLGKVMEQNESFSMSHPANEAHELIFGLLKDKKIDVYIQPDMPVVTAGKARIRELYQNLLENAVKFSIDQQNPLIKVFARKDDGIDVFCVQDNGMGILPKYHEKIFGLFNKLDSNSPGTGLGLSLVKRIVETHNGKIWVESDGSNQGTTFCFTLHTEDASN